jgi:hypothetical protein
VRSPTASHDRRAPPIVHHARGRHAERGTHPGRRRASEPRRHDCGSADSVSINLGPSSARIARTLVMHAYAQTVHVSPADARGFLKDPGPSVTSRTGRGSCVRTRLRSLDKWPSQKVTMSPPSTPLMTATTKTTAPRVGAAPENELAAMADAVLEGHAELDRTVTRLRELCVTLVNDEAAAGFEAAALVERFESQLMRHFAAEEAEEFFGSLLTEEPRLLHAVGRLEAEHGAMADALDELLEFALTRPSGPALAAPMTQFLDRFDTHEHAENALLQEFYTLDAGRGGE